MKEKMVFVSCWCKAVEYYADYVEKLGLQQTHLVILRVRSKGYTIDY